MARVTRDEPVEALQQRRAALALDAAEGKAGAATALAAVEAALGARAVQAEREALARGELERRTTAAQQAAEAERRTAARRRLRLLGAEQVDRAIAIDTALDSLLTAIEAFSETSRTMYEIVATLNGGAATARVLAVDALHGAIQHRLSPHVPALGRAAHHYRASLAQILAARAPLPDDVDP